MVLPAFLPSAGDDEAEPLDELPDSWWEARAVLVRIAPVLKHSALKLAGGDRELRRDLLQEGSSAVVRAVDNYHPGIGTLDGYAAAQAKARMWTVCRQHHRRQRFICYRDPHPAGGEPGFDPVDPASVGCPSCLADYQRVRELIPTVLTLREQQVVTARYYEGLKGSETAKKLRLSKARVVQLESSALAKLRLMFDQPVNSFS